MPRPELAPPVDAADIAQTVDAIVAVQRPDGSIPWVAGGHLDPWDHVEAAMALSAGGRVAEAEAAYRWLASTQRPDGTWAAGYRDGRVVDATVDANFCAYVAAGVWHHAVATADCTLLAAMWPTVEAAVAAVLSLQAPTGEVLWARDPQGRAWSKGLVTSSSCIHLSLRCAAAGAAALGMRRVHWEDAAERLAAAVAHRPELFEPKDRYSMDWYYPVLGGVLVGAAARVRLAERWDEFVVEGLGVRCVADRPWVTVAESCELALALDAAGRREDAFRILAWVQRLRDPDGSYWTGVTFPDEELWPEERPTWTSGAVVLAADALLGLSRASAFFRVLHEAADDDLLEAAGSA